MEELFVGTYDFHLLTEKQELSYLLWNNETGLTAYESVVTSSYVYK